MTHWRAESHAHAIAGQPIDESPVIGATRRQAPALSRALAWLTGLEARATATHETRGLTGGSLFRLPLAFPALKRATPRACSFIWRNIFTGDFAVILLATYGYWFQSAALCFAALFCFTVSAGLKRSAAKMQSELIQLLRNRIELQERTEETLRATLQESRLDNLRAQASVIIAPLSIATSEQAIGEARQALDDATARQVATGKEARRLLRRASRRLDL